MLARPPAAFFHFFCVFQLQAIHPWDHNLEGMIRVNYQTPQIQQAPKP